MPKSLGSVKRSKQHVNNTQDTKNVKTLKMLWPSKKLLIHQLSLGMTLGNNNEIQAMPKKPITNKSKT